MADLFSITAPCIIIDKQGHKSIMAEKFAHPEGLLYFDLYWDTGLPAETMHLVKGEVAGEGPWKIGNHVIHILGCEGSDPEMAVLYSEWQQYMSTNNEYPPEPLIAAIAHRKGCQ